MYKTRIGSQLRGARSLRRRLHRTRLSVEKLEPRTMLAATLYVDDIFYLDADLDTNGEVSEGDVVTFALGEPGETTALEFGTEAFSSIQQAIDTASHGDTVQVAAGTYQERLIWETKDIRLLGAGADATIVDAAVAVTEGDFGRPLYLLDVPSTARVEGFTFTGGDLTNNQVPRGGGGGGLKLENASPTIAYNRIIGNWSWGSGGAVSMLDASNPLMIGNTITHNVVTGGSGGGFLIVRSAPTLIGNTISHNSANAWGGGLFIIRASVPTLINNVIASNTAQRVGGGIYIQSTASAVLANNTLVGNTTFDLGRGGGGIWSDSVVEDVTNSIVWGNAPDDLAGDVSASYSNIGSGNTSGEGNISMDPLFVDAGADDYHLQPGSPAIDAGTNAGAPLFDLDGNPRPADGDGDGIARSDMGAYEFQVQSPQDQIQALIDSDVLNEGQGNSFLSKLDGAQASFDRGNVTAGINQLEAFINQVEAFMRSGKLTAGQGQELIEAAEAVIHSALPTAEAEATDAAFADLGGGEPILDSPLDDLIFTGSSSGKGKGKK